jgi:hypothetical protein
MKQHNISDCLSIQTTDINAYSVDCNTASIADAVIINMNLNGFLLKNPSNVLKCKLVCDSGIWTMQNIHGFIPFAGGLYVEKIRRGQIKVLMSNSNTGLNSTDFSVCASGIQVNSAGTDGDHVMLVSPKTKEFL